jgi:hypothetical protein
MALSGGAGCSMKRLLREEENYLDNLLFSISLFLCYSLYNPNTPLKSWGPFDTPWNSKK